jgi:hypothetical protein
MMGQPKLLSDSLKITLTMDSDWHIGAGVGRPGDVDSLVRRDEYEMPFVPAKTLTGIWRDACETVARGLDGDEEGVCSVLCATSLATSPLRKMTYHVRLRRGGLRFQYGPHNCRRLWGGQ